MQYKLQVQSMYLLVVVVKELTKEAKIYENVHLLERCLLPTPNKMNYRQNVPPMDRQETLKWWLQESHDPFHGFEPDYRTAFLEAQIVY